jgi:hypothetical protein
MLLMNGQHAAATPATPTAAVAFPKKSRRFALFSALLSDMIASPLQEKASDKIAGGMR